MSSLIECVIIGKSPVRPAPCTCSCGVAAMYFIFSKLLNFLVISNFVKLNKFRFTLSEIPPPWSDILIVVLYSLSTRVTLTAGKQFLYLFMLCSTVASREFLNTSNSIYCRWSLIAVISIFSKPSISIPGNSW
eukprot:NODE_68_length_23780_cov_0.251003.p10 type:complete len:133 gc:universal NODE_68_length_23780_cov_0.251003:10237-9839(-)